MWDCDGVNFATTCKKSEYYCRKTRNSVVKHVTKTHNVLFNLFYNIFKAKKQPILLKIAYICERFGPQLLPLSTLECYGNSQVTPF